MTREKIFIQGYGYSGGTLIGDFFHEFNDLNYLYKCEFDLCRASGGIYEIGDLIENSSPYTKDSLIRRYLKLSKYFSNNETFKCFFRNNFEKLSNDFINSILYKKIETPIRYFTYHEVLNFPKKNFTEKLFLRKFLNKYQMTLRERNFDTNTYYLKNMSQDDYIKIAKDFLEKLFHTLPEGKVVLHHPLSIDCQKIDTQLKYWQDYKMIISDKDPRDIYCTIYEKSKQFDYLKVYENVDNFIEKYKESRKYNEYNLNLVKDKGMYIHSEDFVYNYDKTKDKLVKFFNLNEKNHVNKFSSFNPEISIKNIGIYKNFKNINDIKKIEKHLEKYLYTPPLGT